MQCGKEIQEREQESDLFTMLVIICCLTCTSITSYQRFMKPLFGAEERNVVRTKENSQPTSAGIKREGN